MKEQIRNVLIDMLSEFQRGKGASTVVNEALSQIIVQVERSKNDSN